jgi:hypothetical protein
MRVLETTVDHSVAVWTRAHMSGQHASRRCPAQPHPTRAVPDSTEASSHPRRRSTTVRKSSAEGGAAVPLDSIVGIMLSG